MVARGTVFCVLGTAFDAPSTAFYVASTAFYAPSTVLKGTAQRFKRPAQLSGAQHCFSAAFRCPALLLGRWSIFVATLEDPWRYFGAAVVLL